MIVTLLMTLEGSLPEISRCVNVDDSMDLGELSQVIDAAFGFSGAATHLYATGSGEFRHIFAEIPSAGESDETELIVAKISEITYIYDPTANWTVQVAVLGESQLDGPTPLLIDACGPDIVESANGPELMTKFRNEARRIAAGLPPDMEVTPLLLSFLPVMSPERMLQRLTVVDPVSVATRIGFVAEEIYFDQPIPGMPDVDAPDLADEFEDFLDSRPELRQIMQDDPNPDLNPTLLSAVAEFFEDKLGPDGSAMYRRTVAEPLELADVLYDAVDLFSEPVVLTKTGKLPVAAVRPLAELLGRVYTGLQPRETTFPEVRQLRQFLEGAGLIAQTDGELHVTERGRFFLQSEDPIADFHTELLVGFEAVFGKAEFAENVEHLANFAGIRALGPGSPMVPASFSEVVTFIMQIGGFYTDAGGPAPTASGEALLRHILRHYGFEG